MQWLDIFQSTWIIRNFLLDLDRYYNNLIKCDVINKWIFQGLYWVHEEADKINYTYTMYFSLIQLAVEQYILIHSTQYTYKYTN